MSNTKSPAYGGAFLVCSQQKTPYLYDAKEFLRGIFLMTLVQGSAHANAILKQYDLREQMLAAFRAGDLAKSRRLAFELERVAQRRREVAGFQLKQSPAN